MNVNSKSSQILHMELHMELKYCERCGSIWLRRSGSERTQCTPCARAEAAVLLDAPASFMQLWSRFRAEVEA